MYSFIAMQSDLRRSPVSLRLGHATALTAAHGLSFTTVAPLRYPTWGRLIGALTASAVQKLHDRGIKVYCYTVEGKRGYDNLARLGVDGITGDDFGFLKEW